MRRFQIGQMVVVRQLHLDRSGRNCPGTGRALGTWPLSVELRRKNQGYEVRIGEGLAVVHPTAESVVAELVDFGVDRGKAQCQVATVASGEPMIVEVHERRKAARARSDDQR
jgi:hypothetical protein